MGKINYKNIFIPYWYILNKYIKISLIMKNKNFYIDNKNHIYFLHLFLNKYLKKLYNIFKSILNEFYDINIWLKKEFKH